MSTSSAQVGGTVSRLAEAFWRSDPRVVGHDAVSPLHNAMCELEQFGPGLAFIMTFANVTVFETKEGLQAWGYRLLAALPPSLPDIVPHVHAPLVIVVVIHQVLCLLIAVPKCLGYNHKKSL